MKTKLFFVLIFTTVQLLVNGQGRYYKAQMHCHTTNSDGRYSPVDLVSKYKAKGYEIMFITDHNFLTDSVYVPGVLCIPSEEITFKRHMNGFFLSRNIMPDENFTCQQAIDSVIAQGGLIQLNHYFPGSFTDDNWEVDAPEIISFQNGPHMLEIWNTGTETVQTHDDKSIWDAVLTAGKVVWGSATDDFHPSISEGLEFNKGWNMIWLDTLTKEAVYNALLNGNFYASTGVEITQYQVNDYGNYKSINISSSNANKIKFWGPGHQVLQEFNGSSASFILQNHSYVRIELINEGILGMGNTYAWTQPVFLNYPLHIADNKNDIPYIQLYPNPNYGMATIDIKSQHAGNLKLDILTLEGKFITNVANEYIDKNNYQFIFDISTMPSGFYLLKVEFNDVSKTLIFEKK
jgi:hypothetical protein